MKSCLKDCTISSFKLTYHNKVAAAYRDNHLLSMSSSYNINFQQLSGSSESELVEDKPNLLKLVSLLRSVVRVKGLEAQAAEEELRELQEKYDSTTANVGTSERDLLDQV